MAGTGEKFGAFIRGERESKEIGLLAACRT